MQAIEYLAMFASYYDAEAMLYLHTMADRNGASGRMDTDEDEEFSRRRY